MINGVLLTALGGALGSAARYGVGLAVARLFGLGFPWGTLMVNVVGGLAMGVLFVRLDPGQEHLRLFLGVGVLGGFTTFSSFSLEAVRLAQTNASAAALYVGASVGLCLLACWAGILFGRVQ